MEFIEVGTNRLSVQAMGVADFLRGVAEKLAEGYKLNFDDNDTYPVAYGGFYSVILEKGEVLEESGKKSPGRPKKD